jgi:hypothetical protein
MRTIAILALFLSSWVVASDFQGCPPEGDATAHGRADPANNVLKNRDTELKEFEAVTIPAIVALATDGVSKRHRSEWPGSFMRIVVKNEARAVAAEGYLLAIKQEGPESTNCHSQELRDFHMWLAPSPTSPKSASIVVEITPRIREHHEGWKLNTLKHLAKDHARVRISGWLFLDPEHPDQIGKSRATIWEVHPITRIEIWSGGKWMEL